MGLNERFLQLALSGSEWVLWLLVALSMASAAVIVERWIHYRIVVARQAYLARHILGEPRPPWTQIRALVRQSTTPAAKILKRMIEAVAARSRDLDVILETARGAEKIQLERNLGLLGTVGANAPFVGLLGTVLEILRVFNLLGTQGVTSAQDASSIMTGISEALVATGVGLMVAIPATVAYNAFVRRVGHILGQAQEIAAIGLQFPSTAETDEGDE